MKRRFLMMSVAFVLVAVFFASTGCIYNTISKNDAETKCKAAAEEPLRTLADKWDKIAETDITVARFVREYGEDDPDVWGISDTSKWDRKSFAYYEFFEIYHSHELTIKSLTGEETTVVCYAVLAVNAGKADSTSIYSFTEKPSAWHDYPTV